MSNELLGIVTPVLELTNNLLITQLKVSEILGSSISVNAKWYIGVSPTIDIESATYMLSRTLPDNSYEIIVCEADTVGGIKSEVISKIDSSYIMVVNPGDTPDISVPFLESELPVREEVEVDTWDWELEDEERPDGAYKSKEMNTYAYQYDLCTSSRKIDVKLEKFDNEIIVDNTVVENEENSSAYVQSRVSDAASIDDWNGDTDTILSTLTPYPSISGLIIRGDLAKKLHFSNTNSLDDVSAFDDLKKEVSNIHMLYCPVFAKMENHITPESLLSSIEGNVDDWNIRFPDGQLSNFLQKVINDTKFYFSIPDDVRENLNNAIARYTSYTGNDFGTRELLSVLIPINKIHPLFGKCIESISNIWDNNIECVIGINNSKDEEPVHLLKKWIKQYDNVHRYRIINYGDNITLGEVRNKLLNDARGKYVLFVDSDDAVIPQVINDLLQEDLSAYKLIMASDYTQHVYYDIIEKEQAERDESNSDKDITINDKTLWDNPMQEYKDGRLYQYMWGRIISEDIAHQLHFLNATMFEDTSAFEGLILKTDKNDRYITDTPFYYRNKVESSVSSTLSESVYTGLEACIANWNVEYPNGEMQSKIVNLINYLIMKNEDSVDRERLAEIYKQYLPGQLISEDAVLNRHVSTRWTSELIIASDSPIEDEWVDGLFDKFEKEIILDPYTPEPEPVEVPEDEPNEPSEGEIENPEEPEEPEVPENTKTVEGTIHELSDDAVAKLAELTSVPEEDLREFAKYDEDKEDYTGLLKGAMIKYIANALESEKLSEKYCISFGGDILSKNINSSIRVSDKLFINLSGTFCCFTSNNLKRPGHIKIADINDKTELYDSVTYIRKDDDAILADMMATGLFANGNVLPFTEDVFVIYTKNGLPVTPHQEQSIYIASPWFNEHEEQIKRDMMSPFEFVFDPHETDASKSYDETPGTELAKVIAADNIAAITASAYTVYPKLTDDLGTLFDLGCSIREGNVTLCYNEKDKTYSVIDLDATRSQIKDITEPTIVNVKTRSDAITLGYNLQNKDMIYYETELHDNIMLNTSFKRVGRDAEGNYQFIEVDQKEIR